MTGYALIDRAAARRCAARFPPSSFLCITIDAAKAALDVRFRHLFRQVRSGRHEVPYNDAGPTVVGSFFAVALFVALSPKRTPARSAAMSLNDKPRNGACSTSVASTLRMRLARSILEGVISAAWLTVGLVSTARILPRRELAAARTGLAGSA